MLFSPLVPNPLNNNPLLNLAEIQNITVYLKIIQFFITIFKKSIKIKGVKCLGLNNQCIMLSQEPLISLVGVSERIQVYPYYFKQKMSGAYDGCYLREGVAKKLIELSNQLPEDYFLVILDGWRSIETQNALYEMTKHQFRSSFNNESDLLSFVSNFVALPSKEPPSPHYTGGAVDLTIANKEGWLNMGTDFDDFTEKAGALYFEQKQDLTGEELEIRANRRLLRNAMEGVGFTIHPNEWWHFDYGNLRWARATKKSPIYGGIQLSI